MVSPLPVATEQLSSLSVTHVSVHVNLGLIDL